MASIHDENIPLQPQTKCCDKKLFVLATVNFVINVGAAYVIPFYPQLANSQAHLNFRTIGIIMSTNSLGSVAFSFIFGTMMQIWGRKPSLIAAILGQSLLMFLYAVLFFITDYYYLFIGLSFVTRILQGVSRSIYSIASIAYINIFWKDSFAQKFSLMETTGSMGLIFGPMIGSLINYLFGYWIPLLAQSGFTLFCAFLIYLIIPSDDIIPYQSRSKAKLPLSKALSHRYTALTFIYLIVTRSALNYFNSFFTHHILSYGYDQNVAALIITIPQFAYITVLLTLPKIFNNNINYQLLYTLSLITTIIGELMLCSFTHTYSLIHVYVGLLIIGVGSALNRLPSIPCLIRQIRKIDLPPEKKTLTSLTDMASALFQMNLSMSNLIFSSMGGTVYNAFGGNTTNPDLEIQAFKYTMYVLVGMQIVQQILDLAFNNGFQFLFGRPAMKQEEIEGLLEQANKDINKKVLEDLTSQASIKSETTSSQQEQNLELPQYKA